MYDDDEALDEDIEVVEDIYDDDDEFEVEEEFEEEDEDADPYLGKGKSDRSQVDGQRLDYDEEKKKKRSELAKLSTRLMQLRSDISKRERELRDLEIELEKEDFREIKEKVVAERKESDAKSKGVELPEEERPISKFSSTGIEISGTDIDEEVMTTAMRKEMERKEKRDKRDLLAKELKEVNKKADTLSREVSNLERAVRSF